MELAPDWLQERLLRGRPRRVAATAEPLVDLDRPEAVRKAIEWLRGPAEAAVQQAGGDEATYRVCARMRDFGLSADVAYELVSEHWNENEKAAPPWPPEDLRAKVDNAYAYGTGAIGSASGLVDFAGVIEAPAAATTPKKPKMYWVPFKDAAELALSETAEPLIEGLIDQGAMAVIYGTSNSGKTFFVLDLAYHIATGRPWQGRETAKGLVVYIAAEAARGVYKRLAALRKHYGGEDAAFALVPCPVNLLNNAADLKTLLGLVREAEAHFGQPAMLVVVDTLSRVLAGGDENGPQDMTAFVGNVDKIRAATKAAVGIIHHSGKDVAKGARGHSSLRAATDTEIEIADSTIKTTKQRDMDAIKDIKFRLDDVPLGTDAKGRPVKSAVVKVVTGSEFMKVELSGVAAEMYDAFVDQAKQQVIDRGEPMDNWQHEKVSTDAWEKSYCTFEAETESKAAKKGQSTLRRLRQNVAESGYVRKVEHNQWIAETLSRE